MNSPFGKDKDNAYMHRALAQARKAFAAGEVPVGAVVVDAQGGVLAAAYNRVEQMDTQTAHAEMRAITSAGRKRGDWRLDGCWLYVTLEPCTMCMGLATLSRFEGVIFGATSPLFGYRLDKQDGLPLYKRDIKMIIEGICGQEAADLLKQFFKNQRMRRERSKE